jgi:hypothetical protein
MKTFVKGNTWLPGMAHGWGNGYVLIPKGHPLHGKHYDEIDVDVHGGLTFAEKASECNGWTEIAEEDKECWIVGFDTAHFNDSIYTWTKERVEKETKRLAEQLEAVEV